MSWKKNSFFIISLGKNLEELIPELVINSWLTASNQIVNSLSLCYKMSYFCKMVQPIDLIFSKMIEMIEQNIFNRADFSFRS